LLFSLLSRDPYILQHKKIIQSSSLYLCPRKLKSLSLCFEVGTIRKERKKCLYTPPSTTICHFKAPLSSGVVSGCAMLSAGDASTCPRIKLINFVLYRCGWAAKYSVRHDHFVLESVVHMYGRAVDKQERPLMSLSPNYLSTERTEIPHCQAP
jgi:hypothetical protein